MDFSDIFRIINLATGVFMILGGVGEFIANISVRSIIIGIYTILFGLGTGFLEFQIPPFIGKYASFMFSFIGRGVFYIFIGMVSVGSLWYQWIPGTIVAIIGIVYCALEFVPSIEPPANMRDADPNWGAEQI